MIDLVLIIDELPMYVKPKILLVQYLNDLLLQNFELSNLIFRIKLFSNSLNNMMEGRNVDQWRVFLPTLKRSFLSLQLRFNVSQSADSLRANQLIFYTLSSCGRILKVIAFVASQFTNFIANSISWTSLAHLELLTMLFYTYN